MAYNSFRYYNSLSYRTLCLVGKTIHLVMKAITVLGILSILLILVTKFHEVDFSSWKAWLHTSDPILIPLLIAFILRAMWKAYNFLGDWYIRAYSTFGIIGVILLTIFLPVAAALFLAVGLLSIVFPILGSLMESDDTSDSERILREHKEEYYAEFLKKEFDKL